MDGLLGLGHGSSPRVRGTRNSTMLWPCTDRFIPACAGNSRLGSPVTMPMTVHPRVCGELLRRRALLQRRGRFIPACAGNSCTAASRATASTVHPRVCGELMRRAVRGERDIGSSPRVRGTRNVDLRGEIHGRFIPACAGNSAGGRSWKTWPAVHPRVCGELDHRGPAEQPGERFIPACAGNSPPIAAFRRSIAGSSPRVRGTRDGCWRPGAGERFIPACAGNSANEPVRRRRFHGSSPRVRGTRMAPRTGRNAARFIPACAGNSIAVLSALLVSSGSSPRVRGTQRLGRL